jgi:hypothetical protein
MARSKENHQPINEDCNGTKQQNRRGAKPMALNDSDAKKGPKPATKGSQSQEPKKLRQKQQSNTVKTETVRREEMAHTQGKKKELTLGTATADVVLVAKPKGGKQQQQRPKVPFPPQNSARNYNQPMPFCLIKRKKSRGRESRLWQHTKKEGRKKRRGTHHAETQKWPPNQN